ncbi:diguanylate cyclase [Sulfitobacter sp. BDSS02]|nr:diguanylate cyclase [Sulfitobacter sp. BDSS02]MBR9848678.1 diguanylate cyclase [Paracoccaceae bacterium]
MSEWIALVIVSLLSAILTVAILSPGSRSPRSWRSKYVAETNDDAVWIFDGNRLLDASSPASGYIEASEENFDWNTLCEVLKTRFRDLPSSQSELRLAGRVRRRAIGKEDPAILTMEWLDGITRVRIGENSAVQNDPSLLLGPSAREELLQLRLAVNKTPYPIWQLSESGDVVWSNAAYQSLAAKISSKPESETSCLFPILPSDVEQSRSRRVPVTMLGTGDRIWYDVSVIANDEGPLCCAVNVNAVVEAENAQRKFVQTLAKTFAQLSIGLAIFDRNRQLALFNPALIDLTALPAEFLSARPNLLTFFDRLRDQRMMPEPKNYSGWRHQMAELVAAASDGRYQETWSLPSGSVYSVNGRPHPDGAIAFLFEDITAEITLTRRFRSDLEMGQAVLDEIGDAFVVFVPDGTLALCNKAYRDLWNVDPDSSFTQSTVIDATRIWQQNCKATPIWGEIRDFVSASENRTNWEAEITLQNGERMLCRVRPILNGTSLITFSNLSPANMVQINGKPQLEVHN